MIQLPPDVKRQVRAMTPAQFDQLLAELPPDNHPAIFSALLDDDTEDPLAVRAEATETLAQKRLRLKREQSRLREEQKTREGQDIGRIPPVKDPERRLFASESSYNYARTYHLHQCTHGFADYHLRILQGGDTVIDEGGWQALAVPRGGGKSTLCEIIAERAVLTGKKRWPIVVHATDDLSMGSFRNLKAGLCFNSLLLEDFPEVIYPIRALEGSARKAQGQRVCGRQTGIYLGADRMVLPTLPEEEWERWAWESFGRRGLPSPLKTFGSRITVASLTGSIRGKVEVSADLARMRPDLAIADDPQTRESAKSTTQSTYRLQVLKGDIDYLAGGLNSMSLLVPCTIIYPGDMAAQILDMQLNPEFRGLKFPMVESFPTDMEFWNEYRDRRREILFSRGSLLPLNDFYLANRERADAGCRVTWEGLYTKTEVSAVQHAMTLWIKDPEAFAAEAQNEPLATGNGDAILTPVTTIIDKQSHVGQFIVPGYCERIGCHIDVQHHVLFYTIVAASTDFEASIVDYGTWPDQKRQYFAIKESLRSYQQEFASEPPLVAMYKAIQSLIAFLATRQYVREDGVKLSIGKILVDCNDEGATVIKACQESPFRNVVLPATGFGVRAKDTALALRPRKTGETKGHEWQTRPKPDNPSVIYGQVNVNWWKAFLHQMFRVSIGPGSINLWKDHPNRHRMFAEHLNAENAAWVTVHERTVAEFEDLPNHPDNHLFDTTVGALVSLSMQGCVVPQAQDTQLADRRRTPRVITPQTLAGRRL